MNKVSSVLYVLTIIAGLGSAAMAVDIETVPVRNISNVPDTEIMITDGTTGYGSVDYEYNMGKYEVTAGQYCEFLNAVAKTDTYGLYNDGMNVNPFGCQITQNGNSGNYTYDFSGHPSGTLADWQNRPVNFVSWGDAARFANWLHNGQPTGAQDPTTTEDGAYFLNGATSDAELLAVSRKPDWKWAIPTEDEWYKAAYYDPTTSSYYDYATSSNTLPGYVNDAGNLSGTGTPFTEGGTDPGNYATHDDDGGTDGLGSPYFRTEVGEWENSDSPYGTFDQAGNIHEWNEAVLQGAYRGLRGAQFSADGFNLHAKYRRYSDPTTETVTYGFRVTSVPEPATLAMLAFAGLGVLVKPKRHN